MNHRVAILWGMLSISTLFFAAEYEVKDGDEQIEQSLPYVSRYGTGQQVAAKLQSNAYTQDEKDAALRIASRYGEAASVVALLEAKADANSKNKYGRRALHLAAKPSIAKSLVDAQADIEAEDNGGDRPLMRAVIADNYGVMGTLLGLAALIDAPNKKGWLPIHEARNGYAVKNLLDAKGNVNARGEKGATRLHLACERGELNIVMLLLENKATVDAPL